MCRRRPGVQSTLEPKIWKNRGNCRAEHLALFIAVGQRTKSFTSAQKRLRAKPNQSGTLELHTALSWPNDSQGPLLHATVRVQPGALAGYEPSWRDLQNIMVRIQRWNVDSQSFGCSYHKSTQYHFLDMPIITKAKSRFPPTTRPMNHSIFCLLYWNDKDYPGSTLPRPLVRKRQRLELLGSDWGLLNS